MEDVRRDLVPLVRWSRFAIWTHLTADILSAQELKPSLIALRSFI